MRLAATRTDAPAGRPVAEGANWLGLAASPTLAFMAWVTALGAPGMCSTGPSWMAVNDMALMYLLMSLFHLSPWLRVLSHRLATPHRPN